MKNNYSNPFFFYTVDYLFRDSLSHNYLGITSLETAVHALLSLEWWPTFSQTSAEFL